MKDVITFDWDQGNKDKNQIKHKVSNLECEEVFLNKPFVYPDLKHSHNEERFFALGETKNKRLLYICFTIRKNSIRVISARDQHKKERIEYNNLLHSEQNI